MTSNQTIQKKLESDRARDKASSNDKKVTSYTNAQFLNIKLQGLNPAVF